MEIHQFLQSLFGPKPPGHIAIWTRQDKRTHWFPAADYEDIEAKALELARDKDVYFGVSLQDKEAAMAEANRRKDPKEPPKDKSATRGSAATAMGIGGLWLDVDARGPAHKADDLPPTKEDAIRLVNEFPLLPTITIDSGHGIQVWWLFPGPWIFADAADRQKAQELSRRFQATMHVKAQAHGWRIDSTHDLARVLRLPGTVNWKLEPEPVGVLSEE